MQTCLDAGRVDLHEMSGVLGRLGFAAGPLPLVRPFLGPIYAWLAVRGYSGDALLPWSIRFLFFVLLEAFAERNRIVEVRGRGTPLGEAFRADAKAEGNAIVLGGWECLGGRQPRQARWFALTLDRQSAPWAYARGQPFRSIAALELYATLVCILLFADAWPRDARGTVSIVGTTDNAGNTFLMNRLMSSKFPAVVVLAELAKQLRSRGVDLHLAWAPRDQNEAADALTNGAYEEFDSRLRIPVQAGELQFKVLDQYMEAAEALYQATRKERAAPAAARPKAKGRKLRDTAPW